MTQAQNSIAHAANVLASISAGPVQTTKPKADKKAAAKPAAKSTKPAGKPGKDAPTQAATAAVKAAKPAIAYGVHNGSRPGAGKVLFAFTNAWLHASGMLDGKAYSRSEATKVAGSTAIAYHVGNGNMIDKKGALTLSAKGASFFKARAFDANVSKAYAYNLKSGKADMDGGFKNADALFAIASK